MTEPLFRDEVLPNQGIGSVSVARPADAAFWTAFSLAALTIVGCLLCFGQYTRTAELSGTIHAQGGPLELRSPQAGVVQQVLVQPGEKVTAGRVLFAISSERINEIALEGAQQAVIDHLKHRRASLRADLGRQRHLSESLERSVFERIRLIEEQLKEVRREATLQDDRVALNQGDLRRYASLVDDKFLSEAGLHQKVDSVMALQTQRAELSRSAIELQRERNAAAADLTQLRSQRDLQAAATERDMDAVDQDLALSQSAKSASVATPVDGIVAAVLARPGESVTNEVLATIVPTPSRLEVRLLASSASIGFLSSGQRMSLRVSAFPFQKFGTAACEITRVDTAALPVTQLPPDLQLHSQQTGESYFAVFARLRQESIRAYGQDHRLADGMQATATVTLERRPLIRIVLDPLEAALKGPSS